MRSGSGATATEEVTGLLRCPCPARKVGAVTSGCALSCCSPDGGNARSPQSSSKIGVEPHQLMTRKTFELTQDVVHTAQMQTGGRLSSIRAKLTSKHAASHACTRCKQTGTAMKILFFSNAALPKTVAVMSLLELVTSQKEVI